MPNFDFLNKSADALWRRIPGRRGQKIALVLLAALFVGLLVFLGEATKPWDGKIAARIAEGRNLRVRDYIVIGSWWAALANAGLCFLLLLTSRWWVCLDDPSPAGSVWLDVSGQQKRVWWMVATAAMGLCLLLSWPRMFLSLWGDEDYSLRQVILGDYRVAADGGVTLKRLTLAENLWTYKGPNNHFLFTVPARFCNDLWARFFREGGAEFNEFALRIPALLAGLLSLPALGLLMARMGFARAGLIAMLFMALHPWHMKYASEARGYSMVLLFAALACFCLLEAWRTARWRWWLGFAFSNFGAMYAYPAALYLAVSLGLAAAVGIFVSRASARTTWTQVVRLAVAGLLSAMLYLQLVLPTLPQMLLWLKRDRARGVVDAAWLQDFWGWLSAGMAWNPWGEGNPLAHSVGGLAPTSPVFFWFLAVGVPALAVLGLLRMLASGRAGALIALAFLLAPALAVAQAVKTGNLLYVWYLIYALPAFVAWVALGIDGAGAALARQHPRLGQYASVAAFVIFLALYLPATQTQRSTLRQYPVEPQRDSVLLTRPTLDPHDPVQKTVLTGTVTFGAEMYDPLARAVLTMPELEGLMSEADRAGCPLFMNFGSEGFARATAPEVVNTIEHSGRFDLVRRLHGLDVQNTRVVYRYAPVSGGQ